MKPSSVLPAILAALLCACTLTHAQPTRPNIIAIVTADGSVSSRELRRVLSVATEAHGTLFEVYLQQEHVKVPAALLGACWGESFEAANDDERGGAKSTPEQPAQASTPVTTITKNSGIFMMVTAATTTASSAATSPGHAARTATTMRCDRSRRRSGLPLATSHTGNE